jgi:beta-N-acetylhexosaminidase
MRQLQPFAVVALLLSLLPPLTTIDLSQQAQSPDVDALLEGMSPEERVGQLFMVTFYGAETGPDSDVRRLIAEYHVGGVALSASHDNFVQDDLPAQVLELTGQLQTLAAESQNVAPGATYAPLFIAIEQSSDHQPYSQIMSGLTDLPSPMSIGATWEPAHAEAVGQVAGTELAALGINMLLGPSLDVLETPRPGTQGDPGVRTFGGEPFWVSQMGAAYVRGVHLGSDGRVAVIPSHFPGLGGADRQADVEVPTVRRSLDYLTQVDLAPFFAVTTRATQPEEQADGILTGHIRYQGFQGDNPRLTTRPISLDPQALQVLLGLEQIASWYTGGGLVVSDALGARGVKRIYDPQERTFPNRRVALDAFNAGNDILYLSEFGLKPEVDQTQTIIDTIQFFVQKYDEDQAFRERVDTAVERILHRKLAMYPVYTLRGVMPNHAGLARLGESQQVSFDVAQDALTLLSPGQGEVLDTPRADEHIVIFTDTRARRQCSECMEVPLVAVDALAKAILRLYGPNAGGIVSPDNIRSLSFGQLYDFLEFGPAPPSGEGEGTPEADEVAVSLDNADWIVFVMLDVEPDVPQSAVVKRFLADRPDLAANAHVVVLAMDAPYYLDSTEISKLAAYYALYSRGDPFIDVAARALFQESRPVGASPVSVVGINYDLIQATSPDPSQIIRLVEESGAPGEGGAPAPLDLERGDSLRLRTDAILDVNGHSVPDGTPVEFVFNYVDEGLRNTQRVTTVGGVARTSLLLDRVGRLEISATSEPALLSNTVSVTVTEERVEVAVLAPNITPTAPIEPSPPTQTAESAAAPIATPPPAGWFTSDGLSRRVGFDDLFLMLVGLVLVSGGAFWYGRNGGSLNEALLLSLPGAVLGLLAYNYYALALPGSEAWLGAFGRTWSASAAAWAGALLGLGVGAGLRRWRRPH